MDSPFPLFAPPAVTGAKPSWQTSSAPVPYPDALSQMQAHVAGIRDEGRTERIWLLEHPALYTAGTSAKAVDLTDPSRFPVFKAGRGGQYTYHGPGQRVAYIMLDLSRREKDIRCFVNQLEGWIIDTLAHFEISAERREGRVGVWVVKPDGREAKIAAIGVRVRKWVTFHGISINLNPDLSHFGGIVPCGISDHGVTSFADLGINADMAQLDAVLKVQFERRFGPVKSSS